MRLIHRCRLLSILFLCSFLGAIASADTEYYRHVLFDNSLESDAYYYSDEQRLGAFDSRGGPRQTARLP